jgi:hypothetical protein
MSEITAAAAPHDPDLAGRAIRLGAEGCSVREIAVGLGLSLADLQARQDEDADFAEAMVRADEAAWAWWEGLPRAALAEGRRFDHVAWREAMRARFGDEATGPGAGAATDEPSAEPRGVIIMPCNGRRRRPDGSCPYADQDTSQWPDRWFEGHRPRPCHDGRYDGDDNAGFAPGYDDGEDGEEA